jgi:hypothetical protein
MPPPVGAPVATPGGNFKSGKNKTIALIVGGVVATGLLGGLAGVLLSGGDDKPDKPSASEPGSNGSGILDPDPVGSAPPQPDPGTTPSPSPTTPASEPPSPAPTEPAPVPVPVPDPASGDVVTLGATGVQVPVPSGFQVVGDVLDDAVLLKDEQGNFVYSITGYAADAATDAGEIINGQLERLLPPDRYSQVEFSEFGALEPFGSVVSLSVIEYRGLWSDPQGSVPVYGQIYAAVRQDSTVLIVNPENSSQETLNGSIDSWSQVVDGALNLFGAA